MKRYLFILLLFISVNDVFGKGIIIADEFRQTELFNSTDSGQVLAFSNNIIDEYDKVIIHLGRNFVFRKGNIYTTEISKKNLALFCRKLQQSNVKIYIWFFDSFGNENFQKIYSTHKEASSENLKILKEKQIYFDGIAIDLEWINHGLKDSSNIKKFTEITSFLRSLIHEKPIYYFTSLIDSEDENLRRGYNVEKLKTFNCTPIVMLYIKDGGYTITSNKLIPEYSDSRIKELIKYYKKNNWETAYSVDPLIVSKNAEKECQISHADFQKIKFNLNLRKSKKHKFYTIIEYSNSDLNAQERIYMVKINTNNIDNNFYIWEYFSMKEQ